MSPNTLALKQHGRVTMKYRLNCSVCPQIDARQQEKVIREGFEELIQDNDFVVVEGTGHIGEKLIVAAMNLSRAFALPPQGLQ